MLCINCKIECIDVLFSLTELYNKNINNTDDTNNIRQLCHN